MYAKLAQTEHIYRSMMDSPIQRSPKTSSRKKKQWDRHRKPHGRLHLTTQNVSKGAQLLYEAVKSDNLDTVKLLVYSKTNYNVRFVGTTHGNYTALILATRLGHLKIVEYLLGLPNIDTRAQTYMNDRNTALHWAAYGKDAHDKSPNPDRTQYDAIVDALLTNDSGLLTILSKEPKGKKYTAMDFAAHKGHLNCIDIMTRHRALVEIPEEKKHEIFFNAFRHAVHCDQWDVAHYLFKHFLEMKNDQLIDNAITHIRFYECVSETKTRQKGPILKKWLRADKHDISFIHDLLKMDFSVDDMKKVLHGAHVKIKDDRLHYTLWMTRFDDASKRKSSHKSKNKQLSRQSKNKLFPELLFGTDDDGSWFQVENTPAAKGFANTMKHSGDYIDYKVTGKNIGPYGRSKHTDSKPIIVIPQEKQPTRNELIEIVDGILKIHMAVVKPLKNTVYDKLRSSYSNNDLFSTSSGSHSSSDEENPFDGASAPPLEDDDSVSHGFPPH